MNELNVFDYTGKLIKKINADSTEGFIELEPGGILVLIQAVIMDGTTATKGVQHK